MSSAEGCSWLILALLGLSGFAWLVEAEWHDGSGPWVIASKGEPWPMPLERQLSKQHYRLLATSSFDFKIVQQSCDVLEEAIERYRRIIANEAVLARKYSIGNEAAASWAGSQNAGNLSRLQIYLRNSCERYPQLASNESYELNVAEDFATLKADSIWGALRGLETFSQLLAWSDSGDLMMLGQKIRDKPLLAHRGLLLDTSRHFLPVEDILLSLEGMAYNKLNVLHWHIVDDNSFPYESAVFPELAAKGAYHPRMRYSAEDVGRVIEEARKRGIRVLPEFDTPGHTRSWGESHPELLTACYGPDGKPSGKLGPMNPANERLYPFMRQLLAEVAQRFPDEYLHLGGDEVPFDCWKSNPDVRGFMHKMNMSTRFEKLEELYVQRLLDIVHELKAKSIVWQEVFDNGVSMHEGTVVHVWTGIWQAEMAGVTRAGHPAILSACWYLDHVSAGGDWLKFYDCDPLNFPVSKPNQKDLLLGGEACMWGEFVDRNNVHPRIWPRASATAERLWSAQRQAQNLAEQRLEEHACRMIRRGLPAQPPNGSGFCLA